MPRQKGVNAATAETRKKKSGGRRPSPHRPRPAPKLGQHFLRDRSATERIVRALGDLSQRTVIEVGPGRGVLTDLLAGAARRVIAVELDRVLAAKMRMKYAALPNVEVIEADALEVNYPALLAPRPAPLAGMPPQAGQQKADIVGNLPYYVASAILLRLFEFHQLFGRMVIMVQREVAERMVAAPGRRDYGVLSATTQMYARVEKLFMLPPGAFDPPPKVQSSVLRLTIAPRFEALRVPEAPFLDFLKLSFGQKRKTLLNNLKARYSDEDVRAAIRAAGLRADVRAEALSLEKTAAVFRELWPGKAAALLL